MDRAPAVKWGLYPSAFCTVHVTARVENMCTRLWTVDLTHAMLAEIEGPGGKGNLFAVCGHSLRDECDTQVITVQSPTGPGLSPLIACVGVFIDYLMHE